MSCIILFHLNGLSQQGRKPGNSWYSGCQKGSNDISNIINQGDLPLGMHMEGAWPVGLFPEAEWQIPRLHLSVLPKADPSKRLSVWNRGARAWHSHTAIGCWGPKCVCRVDSRRGPPMQHKSTAVMKSPEQAAGVLDMKGTQDASQRQPAPSLGV